MTGRVSPPLLLLAVALAVAVAACLTAPVLLVHGAETEAEAQAQAQAAVAELSRPDVDNFCRAGCAWIVIEVTVDTTQTRARTVSGRSTRRTSGGQLSFLLSLVSHCVSSLQKRGVVRPPVSRELGAALASMHLPDPAESVGSGSESLVAQAAEWYNKAAPTVSKLVSEADLSTCVHDCRVVNLYSHDEIMGNNNEDEPPPPPQPQWPVRPAATRPAARRLIGVKGVGKQSRAKKEALSFPQGIAQKRARVGRAVVVRGNTPFVRITDVNGRPLSPRTAKLVSSVIMSHQRGVDLKRPLKGPRSGALVRVDRQHQLQPEASAASESESDSDSSLGGASHYPRFSSVLSRLHVQHQLNQQSLSMALAEVHIPAPGFVSNTRTHTHTQGWMIEERHRQTPTASPILLPQRSAVRRRPRQPGR